MLDFNIVEKLRERYPNLHPLIFHRSKERAKTNGELFDILDSIPNEYPLIWCDSTHRWIESPDLFLFDDFFES